MCQIELEADSFIFRIKAEQRYQIRWHVEGGSFNREIDNSLTLSR